MYKQFAAPDVFEAFAHFATRSGVRTPAQRVQRQPAGGRLPRRAGAHAQGHGEPSLPSAAEGAGVLLIRDHGIFGNYRVFGLEMFQKEY